MKNEKELRNDNLRILRMFCEEFNLGYCLNYEKGGMHKIFIYDIKSNKTIAKLEYHYLVDLFSKVDVFMNKYRHNKIPALNRNEEIIYYKATNDENIKSI